MPPFISRHCNQLETLCQMLSYTVFSGTSRIAYTVVAKTHVVLTLCKKHVSHACDVYEKESWRT